MTPAEPKRQENLRAPLSIIIPSFNPDSLFFSRLSVLLEQHCDWQVIVVDDASDSDLHKALPAAANLTVLRNAQQSGAGFSRNMGIKKITGDYTVFLDDDDAMDWQIIEELMTQMQTQPGIDMAISSYRFLLDGEIKPAHAHDMHILNAVLNGEDSRAVSIAGNENLLQITNYPWNKIYRTDFIRRIDLRFSETLVQNDIFAHWQSLLSAKQILITNLIQCTQTVNQTGNRIGNIADTRRLQAFTAMKETYELVRSYGQPRVEAVFWNFYRDVGRWMIDVASTATRPLLMKEYVGFLEKMNPDLNQLEHETGVKNWEVWNLNQISNMLPNIGSDSISSIDAEQWEIFLTEYSRLKHLTAELLDDDNRVRNDLHNRMAELEHLNRDLHQRIAQSDQLSNELRQRNAECDRLSDELQRITAEREQVNHELQARHLELEQARQECEQRDEQIRDLSHEMAELNRNLNSKAARIAFSLRKIYRIFVPHFGGK